MDELVGHAASVTANVATTLLDPPVRRPPRIVVVIPAYRAEAHIGRVLAGIPDFVQEIIVVDDASPDETATLAVAFPDARVRLFRHANNQGVGGAMLTGYDAAMASSADIIVKMDSDDQMDPRYLPALLAPVLRGEADFTKGNRFLHVRELRAMPWLRRLGNTGLSFLTKLASGYWNVFDPTNGYTAIHATLIPLLDRERIGRRYFFETSMLLELGLLRAVVRDVHIPARYGHERSSLSEWRAAFQFPWLLLRGFLRRGGIQYFIRDFTACSAFLVAGGLSTVLGTIWGAYHWWLSHVTGEPASTGTIMFAVLPLVLGLQLLLQAVVLDIQSLPAHPLQRDRQRTSLEDAPAAYPVTNRTDE